MTRNVQGRALGASRVSRFRPLTRRRVGALTLAASCLLAAAMIWVSGCAGNNPTPSGPGVEEDFDRARAAYDRGDYVQAIEMLDEFERTHPGSKYVDDALFLLGKAHQANDEQILARDDFQRLLSDFPRSPFAEDAHFEIANSWLLAMGGAAMDPEPAEQALSGFRAYMARYPEGKHRAEAQAGIDRALAALSEKDYLNGRTYLRLGRPAAARRYFEKSLELWAESPVSAKALAGIARSYEDEHKPAEAKQAYERLLAHLGDKPERYDDGADLASRARAKLSLFQEADTAKE